jgi:hypothetical protein
MKMRRFLAWQLYRRFRRKRRAQNIYVELEVDLERFDEVGPETTRVLFAVLSERPHLKYWVGWTLATVVHAADSYRLAATIRRSLVQKKTVVDLVRLTAECSEMVDGLGGPCVVAVRPSRLFAGRVELRAYHLEGVIAGLLAPPESTRTAALFFSCFFVALYYGGEVLEAASIAMLPTLWHLGERHSAMRTHHAVDEILASKSHG